MTASPSRCHNTFHYLQCIKQISQTSQQYPRRWCAEVTRWAIVNWPINDSFVTHHRIAVVTTASLRHWLHYPPPTFTTSDLQDAVDISTARSSSDMGVRHHVCKHFACCFYLTTSALFFRCCMAPPITTSSHSIRHAGAKTKSLGMRCGSWRGSGNAKQVRMACNLHLQTSGCFAHLHFARLSNTTTNLYTTTKPHATINLQTNN